jgi:hypothetical protein
MNELKYCKFCDKEKPIKDFVKSGFAIKNICRECQNKKQTQIYKNSKEVEQLQQENKQLKDNWNKLKEYAKEIISTDNELYGTDLLDKMQELERGSDSNVKD